jgi:predicted metal-dependent peptidase
MNYCPPVADCTNLISASLLRLRMNSPFFGTLAMFARFVPSQAIPAAATDGRDIFFNPEFLRSLPSTQQDGLILHEVLHAALLHSLRLGVRDPQLWNIAADIVVNGTIAQQIGCELPPGGLRDEQLEHFRVEEVYALLQGTGRGRFRLQDLDLLTPNAGGDGARAEIGAGHSLTNLQAEEVKAHWRNAIEQATVIARSTPNGQLPGGLVRELGAVMSPQLDWKSYLWRYLVQTPTDFQSFDRRFAYRGLYLEMLQGESVRVYIAIDTSASVGDAQFQLFVEEVRGIVGAYPHLECELFYIDSVAHGPYSIAADSPLPTPYGGGGTSFIPFFDLVTQSWDGQTPSVCIYLTDGYGDFPPAPPPLPTLWVVTHGGLDSAEFPFGEVVRLIESGA